MTDFRQIPLEDVGISKDCDGQTENADRTAFGVSEIRRLNAASILFGATLVAILALDTPGGIVAGASAWLAGMVWAWTEVTCADSRRGSASSSPSSATAP